MRGIARNRFYKHCRRASRRRELEQQLEAADAFWKEPGLHSHAVERLAARDGVESAVALGEYLKRLKAIPDLSKVARNEQFSTGKDGKALYMSPRAMENKVLEALAGCSALWRND